MVSCYLAHGSNYHDEVFRDRVLLSHLKRGILNKSQLSALFSFLRRFQVYFWCRIIRAVRLDSIPLICVIVLLFFSPFRHAVSSETPCFSGTFVRREADVEPEVPCPRWPSDAASPWRQYGESPIVLYLCVALIVSLLSLLNFFFTLDLHLTLNNVSGLSLSYDFYI